MSLFTTDLFRNFAIGFALGAAALGVAAAPDFKAAFDNRAHAAEPSLLELPAE